MPGYMSVIAKIVKPAADSVLTLVFWAWFIFGYLVFFFPLHIWVALFSKNRETGFQKANHSFFRSFFRLVRTATPGLKIEIDERVAAIRSSIVVSNHVSYLDPILLVSIFEKQKTIVKSTFFRVPVFGWILNESGYIPSTTDGKLGGMMLGRIENLPEYLDTGGNLFVFPEGRRSTDGRIGKFSPGVFKIAQRCRAPIKMLLVRNTDRLFRPGRFLFDTLVENTIELEYLGEVLPAGMDADRSISEIMATVRSTMEDRIVGPRNAADAFP